MYVQSNNHQHPKTIKIIRSIVMDQIAFYSQPIKMHKKFTKKKRSEQFNYSPPWKLFRKKAINPLKPLIISLLHSHKVLWTRPNPTSLKGTMKQFKAAKTAEGKAKYLGNLFLDCFWNYCHIIKYEKYFQMVFFF